jgi:murein DD-endopeptidase MepM/ murein hydrolase activator NlpD
MRRLALLLLVLVALPAGADPRADFGWPLPGVPAVDRGFSPPATTWGAGHRGVDLGGYPGEPVVSAGPGKVVYAGMLAGRGVVTVSHDGGLRTTYEPVSASVHVGQLVTRGATLGRLGTGHASCRAATACLHWGLLRGDTYLDPLGLVADQPVRLLPLGPAGAAPTQVAALHAAHASPAAQGPPVGALAAAGSLAIGLTLLASRRRPSPQPPPYSPSRPVDLAAERFRRRAA